MNQNYKRIICSIICLGVFAVLALGSLDSSNKSSTSTSTENSTSTSYETDLTERCKDWIYQRNRAYKLGREGDLRGSERARMAMQTLDRDLRKYFTDKQISDEIA